MGEKQFELLEKEKQVMISPSILDVPFEKVPVALQEIQDVIDFVHIDVMDGIFVPNVTHGKEMFAMAKESVSKPLDVHLMVAKPWEIIPQYDGASVVTFHWEAVSSSEERIKTIEAIRRMGAKVGVSIKPNTPVSAIEPYLNEFDLVLVMTVEPGFGGQTLLSPCLQKIAELRDRGFSKWIEVDGGVSLENASIVREAKPDIIAAGKAIFSAPNPREAIDTILRLT